MLNRMGCAQGRKNAKSKFTQNYKIQNLVLDKEKSSQLKEARWKYRSSALGRRARLCCNCCMAVSRAGLKHRGPYDAIHNVIVKFMFSLICNVLVWFFRCSRICLLYLLDCKLHEMVLIVTVVYFMVKVARSLEIFSRTYFLMRYGQWREEVCRWLLDCMPS